MDRIAIDGIVLAHASYRQCETLPMPVIKATKSIARPGTVLDLDDTLFE